MIDSPPVVLATIGDGSLSGHFKAIDWVVMLGYLGLVSVLGVVLAGKQKDMDDFFRGGSKLPWYAVSASMIATIISAVTFVAVPAIAFAADGDFTYLQFGIIAGFLSRLFVIFVLVPAYYRHRVYSPYDYMGARLGEAARGVTTAMFSLIGLMAQASRVYLTAIILRLILRDELGALADATGVSPLWWAIIAVGVVSVIWTMLGGIATVVWTDAMLFVVFVVGGIIAIAVIASEMPGGLGQILSDGHEAGKFNLFNLGLGGDGSAWSSGVGAVFADELTIWAAIFAVTFGNIGAYGTDQLLAQRIFTCKNRTQAQVAVGASYAAELVAGLMLLVGVGLWAFYREFPEQLVGQAKTAVDEKSDNIFPVFILTQVPAGLTGLIVAGIFAAAISSLTSILAAFAQTTLSAVILPIRGIDPDGKLTPEQNRSILRISRWLIVAWGILLCLVAFGIAAYDQAMKDQGREVPFLYLALGLASYGVGALFAAFLLAWLPLRINAHGLIWAAPLSVTAVFASRFHEPWAVAACGITGGVLVASWIAVAWSGAPALRRKRLARTAWLVVGCLVVVCMAQWLWFAKVDSATTQGLKLTADGAIEKFPISFPWYAPIGGLFAFVCGWLLADPREADTPTSVPIEPDSDPNPNP
ncbi:MAG: hypothetical protein AAF333_03515 [Planctomycetota bacterium]